MGSVRLVVEEPSPEEGYTAVTRRIIQFLKGGVEEVWLLYPDIRSIAVHRPGTHFIMVDAEDERTGRECLPDSRCRVADFFAAPGAAP
jgi:hypothetical protein